MDNKELITEARWFVLNSDDCEYGELLMWMADALEKLEGENEALSQCIEKLKKQNTRLIWRGWNILTERPPTADDADHYGFIIAYSDSMKQSTVCVWHHILDDNVTTHWRQLPQPPTEEDNP